MIKFTYASLFSGIGGFEQALNNFGGYCVFASEIDKFAARAYETLYGHKPTDDVTQVDAKDVPDHDLLVGGFPCQAFSVAGKRKGFEDTRGTLFFEIARIAKEKRPKALLLENVKGLVNHDKGRTLDVMIETLNEIGYVVDFEILNSKYFGVPQNRERIFIVAIREDLIEQSPWIIEGNTIVPKGKRRISEYDWAKTFNFDWPEQGEVTTRLRDILETDVDEKYYLDEEKTAKLVAQLEREKPIISEDSTDCDVIFNASEDVIKDNERQRRIYNPNGISPTALARTDNAKILTAGFADIKGASKQIRQVVHTDGLCPTVDTMQGGHREPKIAEPQMLGHVDIKGNDSIKRTYSTEGISPTLTTMGGGHREPKIAEEQGLPIREATKKGYAIAEEGDSVNIQFPNSKTRRGRVGKQIANTLEASSINQGVVESPPKYRIRKLTPLECFRLQNFPDEAHHKLVEVGISDSQRYKMAGNAVTVSVVEAIAKNLLPLIVGGGTGFEESETSS